MDAMNSLMKKREELQEQLDNLSVTPKPTTFLGKAKAKMQRSVTATKEQTSKFQKARRTLLKKIEELDNKLEKFPDSDKSFP
tara:strand:- start:119 stop:364 length:246 start_codon:yes stop_codon:yes gene_type:complete